MEINLTLPKSWNELSFNQLKRIASCFYRDTPGKLLDIIVFLVLLNIKWYQLISIRNAFIVLRQVPLSELKRHYEFIYSKVDLTKFIPKLKARSKVYYSPGDRMHDITISEFAMAEDLFIMYHKDPDIELLRYLAATLYYELDSQGNKIPFNKYQLDKKVARFRNISKASLLSIHLSYQGSRTEIVNSYPKVFPKQTNKTKKKSVDSSGLDNLIAALTDGKIYHLNEVKNTNIHDFFGDYQKKLVDHQRKKLMSHAS